ncbi:MAG TPA: YcgL domain-containing protein [Gammaproteobacteria bacterium]|nr:YcgL domain-containing protein [Gammaproteobacteria bacterium]
MFACRVNIYKSLRQFDYYLYVEQEQDIESLPEGLLQLLGRLVKVMELELHPGRRLAQADVCEVLARIQADGYYLQMPPGDSRGRPLPG